MFNQFPIIYKNFVYFFDFLFRAFSSYIFFNSNNALFSSTTSVAVKILWDVFALLFFAGFWGAGVGGRKILSTASFHMDSTLVSFTLERFKDEDDIGAISHASGLPALATTSISPVLMRDSNRSGSSRLMEVDASDSRGRIALYDAADSRGRIALNDS